jgi:peptidyl-prolyl cis-trans isomerase D
MLTILRNAAGTWVSKLLLIMLVLSFAVWGISGQIFGGLGTNVVQVGDTRVSVLEYRLAYDRQIRALSQQFGMPLTREQAQAFGLDNQVLSQLVAGAVLDEQAREMRLGLSRDRLAALTAEDPAFQTADGRFDRAQFDWVLRQVGMSPNDYLKNREQVAIRQQVVEAVSDGLNAPDAFLRAMALYQGEDRTVEYIVLPRSLVEPVDAPTDEQVATFFDENKAAYAAPEYRRIAYVKLEPSDIADPASVTVEDARAEYDRTVSRYTTPERRTIEQLVFADAAAADAALRKIRGGASFDDIIAEQGKTANDVLLGTFDKERVADPAIAEAAFAVEKGAVSDVVPGAFGSVLVRVTEITPAIVKPFEEVQDEIRTALAMDEANRILMEVHDGYEDARAAGESMAEAAANQRLQVVTIDAVDRAAKTPEGTILTDLPESAALLREAFDTEIDVENPSINVGSNGYLFYEVQGITPARERPLDEVRDAVVADWTAREAEIRLAERAAELQKRVADGTDLPTIASEIGVEVQTRRGLKRDATDAGLGEAAIAASFGVAQGASGVVAGADEDTQVVFRVAEVVQSINAGPDALTQETRDGLAAGYSDDLIDQLVARLQTQYNVSVDRNAIQQALSF